MKSISSRTGISAAVFAAAMSVVWAFFVPYGYPWPSLAWAVLACASAASVARGAVRPTPSMSEVIGAVEAESAQAPAAPRRGVVSTRAVL
jgi:hypothetical protein